MNATYLATARLLAEIAPVIFEGGAFALKGGTAINLFLRDLPRLSVDLDLVFVDHHLPRAQALAAINAGLRASRDRLTGRGLQVQALETAGLGDTKLLVRRNDLAVKVEVNTVLRGTMHPPLIMPMTPSASEALMADLELLLLSPDEVYGSKLVAAMDRQHPRDLFDVMQLFDHGGITPAIRRCFVVYLACHNRTLHEVLFPAPKEIRLAYEGSFEGMTTEEVPLDVLTRVRERLFRELPAALDADEREFLRTLVRGSPDWALMGIPHLEDLPAIRWRVGNLRRLATEHPARFAALAAALDERLA